MKKYCYFILFALAFILISCSNKVYYSIVESKPVIRIGNTIIKPDSTFTNFHISKKNIFYSSDFFINNSYKSIFVHKSINGIKTGWVIEYFSDGRYLKHIRYRNGKIISRIWYDDITLNGVY